MKCTYLGIFAVVSLLTGAFAQTPGVSTNMVSGTQWPGGDPFLQRQNEPSMAVSSRNPMHVVAGDNDYRTVDLPFVTGASETGDAWLGFFTSYDGGQTWTSTLVPGYPQDTSAQGLSSPVHGLAAGADPVVRPGTNGMFYYSGLAFNRDQSGSSVFVSRYVDDNNLEGGNTIRYIDTHRVAQGMSSSDPNSSIFLDKPTIAVDVPRPGSPTCTIPAGPNAPAETISAGYMYVAYTQFTGPESQANAQIMLSGSGDCGVTWSAPINVSAGFAYTNQGAQIAIDPSSGNFYVAWRIFANSTTGDNDAVNFVGFAPGPPCQSTLIGYLGAYFQINPFDQGTSDTSFRTNAYPAIAVDNNSTVYVAWSQRGTAPNGDAQIVLAAVEYGCGDCAIATTTVDPYNGPGHQIMPALAFSSGKLTAAWYDFRDDDQSFISTPTGGGQYTFVLQPDGTLVFQYQVADPPADGGSLRHTVDIRAAQAPAATPGCAPVFQPSVLVSQYAYGSPAPPDANSGAVEQLEFNAPNLPLFETGSAAFVGDYIDVAGPTFVFDDTLSPAAWRANNLPTDPDYTHVVWADNRNVIPPADGNWADYTPVALSGGTSIFDPSQQTPTCVVGRTGMRNQDIYTATLSPGVIMGALGNSKPLSTTLQREFAVTVQNTMSQAASYRLTIGSQPAGGTASFLQFLSQGQPVYQLDITIPALSSASESVFITSSNANATVPVTAQQITAPGGSITPNGLSSAVILNPDISNPNISNPNISNEEVYNPNISNPNISNPNISNPNISNITIANPDILNPNISNPNISNPNISNPNIANPNIANPNISNTALTDASYIVSNTGNTVSSYTVQLLQNQTTPSGVTVQLIVSGIYTTPVANGCNLTVEAHYVPLLNVTSPVLVNAASLIPPSPPTPSAATFAVAPGQQVMVTIRAYDSTTSNDAAALQHYNPATAITPAIISAGANTGSTQPAVTLTVTTTTLAAGTTGSSYSQTLQAIGGSGSGYTWRPVGSLPSNLMLTSQGVLEGTPSAPYNSTITVQVTDSANNVAAKTLKLSIAQALLPPTVSLTGPQSAVYGTSFSVTPATNAGDTATITATGPCSVNGTSVKMTAGTGTCQLTASWQPTAEYTSATAILNVAATKAMLTVTANSASIVFGQAIPAFTATYSGFVSPDTSSVVTGSPSLTTTATPYSLPGNYPIVVSGNLSAANYTFQFVNGTLTIKATGSVPSSGNNCNGAYTGAFSGNITVSAGQVCEIDGGKVSGNLTSNGGIVILYDATVGGNLQITGTATGAGAALQHQVCGAHVQGNLQFQNDHNPVVIGGAQGTNCGPSTVGGNLQVTNNSALISVTYTAVTGDLQVQNDTGAVVVSNDTVQGNLQVQNNTATSQVSNDTVKGNLQCTGNSSITGTGDKAKLMQGQCAAF